MPRCSIIDVDLYDRFIEGEATDQKVLEEIFSHPELAALHHNDHAEIIFEVSVIDAFLKREGGSNPQSELLGHYKSLAKDQPSDQFSYAKKIVDFVKVYFSSEDEFRHCVQCIELLYTNLENP